MRGDLLMIRALSAVVVVFIVVFTAQPTVGDHSVLQPLNFDRSAVVVITSAGRTTLQVELAETPSQRMQGLQYRHDLGGADGMLFDFGHTRPVSMWMKNTEIPLDMLFIDREGVISHIVENTVPMSMDHISSGSPVRAVLEIAAGQARSMNIAVGDRIEHPIFVQRH